MNPFKLFARDMSDLVFILKVCAFPVDSDRNPLCKHELAIEKNKEEYERNLEKFYVKIRTSYENELKQDHEPNEITEQLIVAEPMLRLKAKHAYWAEVDPELDDLVSVARREIAERQKLIDAQYDRILNNRNYIALWSIRIIIYANLAIHGTLYALKYAVNMF